MLKTTEINSKVNWSCAAIADVKIFIDIVALILIITSLLFIFMSYNLIRAFRVNGILVNRED